MNKYEAFANRLTKNRKHLEKWARRQDVSCYRLYDRDLPEFPLAIDRYVDKLHVQEFQSKWDPDDATYQDWLDQTTTTLSNVFNIPVDNIFYKLRQRQKGSNQYQKSGLKGEDFVVREHGLKFRVNLEAYLDTGLFLDHRTTRAMIMQRASGKRFLNLFAYTGSFSVYAAAGGAVSSMTVDLSKTYQTWTAKNFELNNIDQKQHRLYQGDVSEFLQRMKNKGEHFDLIMMDPPSFSNSKRMQDTLDIQRDHAELIDACMAVLEQGGELFFSNNRRGFKLEASLSDRYAVKDITRQTLPEDFRARGAHQCWLITHE